MCLACSLVSTATFVDPVNSRPLSRGECDSLDAYLAALGLPAVQVTEAFDLASVARSKDGGKAFDEMLLTLKREAASMLRLLDDGESLPISQPSDQVHGDSQHKDDNADVASSEAAGSAAGRRRRWRK